MTVDPGTSVHVAEGPLCRPAGGRRRSAADIRILQDPQRIAAVFMGGEPVDLTPRPADQRWPWERSLQISERELYRETVRRSAALNRAARGDDRRNRTRRATSTGPRDDRPRLPLSRRLIAALPLARRPRQGGRPVPDHDRRPRIRPGASSDMLARLTGKVLGQNSRDPGDRREQARRQRRRSA